MTAAIVCFASSKGGSGKTVTCASLALVMGALGQKVLLIDTDGATNGLTLLFLEEVVAAKRLFRSEKCVPIGTFEADETNGFTPLQLSELVDLVPAVYVMTQTEGLGARRLAEALDRCLAECRERYDYILLDAQAGSDLYAEASITAADQTVLVTEVDPISAEGVIRLRDVFREQLQFGRYWILFNKVLPELAQNRKSEVWTPVTRELSPIPWDRDVVRAFARRKLALDLEVGNAYTLAMLQLAAELFGDDLDPAISGWRAAHEGRLREPVLNNLRRLERELKAVDTAIAAATAESRSVEGRLTRAAYFPFTITATALALFVGLYLVLAGVSLRTDLFRITVISVGFLLISLVVSVMLAVFGRRPRLQNEVRFLAEQSTLRRKQRELEEERLKYKVLADASLEGLVGASSQGQRHSAHQSGTADARQESSETPQ
jgi:cellulose biosynthesis protein BcsQ